MVSAALRFAPSLHNGNHQMLTAAMLIAVATGAAAYVGWRVMVRRRKRELSRQRRVRRRERDRAWFANNLFFFRAAQKKLPHLPDGE